MKIKIWKPDFEAEKTIQLRLVDGVGCLCLVAVDKAGNRVDHGTLLIIGRDGYGRLTTDINPDIGLPLDGLGRWQLSSIQVPMDCPSFPAQAVEACPCAAGPWNKNLNEAQTDRPFLIQTKNNHSARIWSISFTVGYRVSLTDDAWRTWWGNEPIPPTMVAFAEIRGET